ncbi:MAG: threonine synthase [Erysipelotrichaceae bacterium]|nr:threonine synthase [Erysipelotrichaceae bacterium]
MRYFSTRGHADPIAAKEAILKGLANDGGLFVPEQMPEKMDISRLSDLSYGDLAQMILSRFFDDYAAGELSSCINGAYSAMNFDTPAISPSIVLDEAASVLELWHGPTCAFKDLALTILPRLLTTAYNDQKQTGTVAILTATSGDTGKAALAGFADVPHTAITVFYPRNGVSPIQELQMRTSPGNNVNVIAVNGNFDDCQRLVKEAVAWVHLPSGVRLCSANSINIGRLVPQIVYYFAAYQDLLKQKKIAPGEEVLFAVPTGNFGDILAGWLAKQIGLPVKKLICASNSNRVLTDFLESGTYSIHRPFHVTMSPSMDILISSNLERLLYFKSNGDSAFVETCMGQLSAAGQYTVPSTMLESIRQDFGGYSCSEEQCAEEIRNTWNKHHYLMDPHTAVAAEGLRQYREASGDHTQAVILSTASPYKFAGNVLKAVNGSIVSDPFAAMDRLSEETGTKVPSPLARLASLPLRFDRTIEVKDGIELIQKQMEELAHD